MNKTAKILRALRRRTGETQSDVAMAIGVAMSTYSMYERGERTPRDKIKLRISNHFSVPVQEIFFSEYNT